MRLRFYAFVLMTLAACESASAERKVGEYRAVMASRDATVIAQFKLYLGGVGVGIWWANLFAEVPPFCRPAVTLNTENYKDILDREIARTFDALRGAGAPEADVSAFAATFDEIDVEFVLLNGLRTTFPCPANPSASKPPKDPKK